MMKLYTIFFFGGVPHPSNSDYHEAFIFRSQRPQTHSLDHRVLTNGYPNHFSKGVYQVVVSTFCLMAIWEESHFDWYLFSENHLLR